MDSQDEMVVCPYNFSHVILKPRMSAHLIKCRQQNPSLNFSLCPFNSTHDIPTPELPYHMEVCEDRKKLDSFIYVNDEIKPTPVNKLDIKLPISSENWDEEPTQNSYLDVKNQVVESKPIFRVPVGLTKAERKAFFQQEVQKFENALASSSNAKTHNKCFRSLSEEELEE